MRYLPQSSAAILYRNPPQEKIAEEKLSVLQNVLRTAISLLRADSATASLEVFASANQAAQVCFKSGWSITESSTPLLGSLITCEDAAHRKWGLAKSPWRDRLSRMCHQRRLARCVGACTSNWRLRNHHRSDCSTFARRANRQPIDPRHQPARSACSSAWRTNSASATALANVHSGLNLSGQSTRSNT